MNKEKDNQELLIGKDWEGNQIHIHHNDLHKAEYVDVQAMLNDTLDKLDKIEKIEIFMTFLNFTTKALSLYLVLIYYDTVFKYDSLLLFSYLLYALLEVVAFGAAFAVVLSARIISALLGVNVFYLDSFIYLPILYSVFKFCFVVTFLVQSLTVVIFSKFSHWVFPLVLVQEAIEILKQIASLFVTLILQVSRLILMVGGKVSSISKCFDTNWIFKILAPENWQKSYQLTRNMLYQFLNIFEELNPEYKEFIQKGYKYQKQVIELKEDIEWAKDFIKRSIIENNDVPGNTTSNRQSLAVQH
ncbi:unnamed protein product (macronuclear) [Paramecium tetraurelia]|uniref:Uncharacterized protein n=1 Tax=Paramecium tetraurelia TaxID=5888 RepID=A0CU33_PARTE|nr:uncharacterized protein GSPATT00010499001 [Paramecium tetraurelia]CAK74300.1 unnamed protein product [Paramecium tetraurelia]|eukprot:XP_001441697.1 hypothetical protein (macronuclear) [Paramecium tetraurelia strain d4-2]